MPPAAPCVAAIITTYRRPAPLARALESWLRAPQALLAGVLVVDNNGPAAGPVPTAAGPGFIRHLPQAANRGHGAGHAAGLRAALENPAVTHFLLLDDDAEILPDTLPELLRGMRESGASVAVPLLENAAGRIAWFPGPLDRRRRREIRRPGVTPDDFCRTCGEAPAAFDWAPWCVLLVDRAAVEAVGLPRDDFGFMADDIEYVFRLTTRHRAVLVPRARARHLPPAVKAGAHGYYTDCLNLQNMSYLVCRLPHGRRAARYLPGHFWRFFRHWGVRGSTLRDAIHAWALGAACGRPAGTAGGGGFLRRWRQARGEPAVD